MAQWDNRLQVLVFSMVSKGRPGRFKAAIVKVTQSPSSILDENHAIGYEFMLIILLSTRPIK
jgi:hypothetical protein